MQEGDIIDMSENTKYWIILQDARDTDSRGNFRSLHKLLAHF